MDPDDVNSDNLDEFISKPNRAKTEEAEDQKMIVGPKPPTGIHILDRKTRDRRRNLKIKELIK